MKKITPLSILLIFAVFCTFFSTVNAQSPTVNMRLRSRLVFTGQDAANICGYAANGREYALVGTSGGAMIVDVTNPDVPKLIRKIPAVTSSWREIKVYKNFAYITTEGGGQGLQIVNLSNLPDSASIVYKNFTHDSVRGLTNISRIHALHIDTTKGFCYLYGGASTVTGVGNVNGAVILDLKTDPYNPRYIGNYHNNYIHDGYVDNDTLYASHIYNGYYSIIDFRDKLNPITLSTTTTPTVFTHNTWLTPNHKNAFTTDENCGSYLGSYDVSNPQQPRLLDKIRSISGESAIIHNTHILNDYAITSWYTEGIIITDVHRPHNLVNVAQYDTYPENASDFEGCWGVYPFLPSGNLVASNITAGELFVVTPQYKRASYLEGNVIDSTTRQPLSGVRVKIKSNDMDKQAESAITGNYATGQVTAGTFDVTYSKKGYVSKTISVNLVTAQVVLKNIELRPARLYSFNGTITAQIGGLPLSDIEVLLKNEFEEIPIRTNTQGVFSASVLEGNYKMYVGEWGFIPKFIANQTISGTNPSVSIQLQKGYADNFASDFGWKITGNAATGMWVRGTPLQASSGVLVQPGSDYSTTSDNDDNCFFTGNGDCEAGNGDVDGGFTTITSKKMALSNYIEPQLTFNYWFYNGGGSGTPNDTLRLTLSNGVRDTTIWIMRTSGSTWRQSPALKLKNFLPLTDSMTLAFYTADATPGHVLEAAIDNVRVVDAAVPNSVKNIDADWQVKVFPNPFDKTLNVDYQLDTHVKNYSIKIFNALGQLVEAQNLPNTEGVISLGASLQTGVYFIRIESENKVSRPIRIVKSAANW